MPPKEISRAALTFSEPNLLEFVEFAPPAARLAAETARSLAPVLGVLGNIGIDIIDPTS